MPKVMSSPQHSTTPEHLLSVLCRYHTVESGALLTIFSSLCAVCANSFLKMVPPERVLEEVLWEALWPLLVRSRNLQVPLSAQAPSQEGQQSANARQYVQRYAQVQYSGCVDEKLRTNMLQEHGNTIEDMQKCDQFAAAPTQQETFDERAARTPPSPLITQSTASRPS